MYCVYIWYIHRTDDERYKSTTKYISAYTRAKYTKDHSHHVDIRLVRKQIIRTQPAGLVNGEEATTSNSLGVYVTLSI